MALVLPWLPSAARDALDLLRRPGLTRTEQALAASIASVAVEKVVARGPVTAEWLALARAEVAAVVGDLVDDDDLDVETLGDTR